MFRRLASIVAVTVGALASAGAAADTVTITDFKWGSSNIDTSMSGAVSVGQFKGLLNGIEFVTYCTDLFETFNWNTSYNNYFVAANGSTHGFTLAQADLLGKLYTVADALVNTTDESVAFQLAVWEALYDAPTHDVSSGNFYVQSGGNANQLALANAWLAQAEGLGSSQFNVARLASVDAVGANDGHQDFIVVSRVPEPASTALLFAGFAGLGLSMRRRSAKP